MITIFLEVGLFALLWHGRYQTFERVLIGFVIFMGISFVMVFFMAIPSPFREVREVRFVDE